jgi:hypothetical protein
MLGHLRLRTIEDFLDVADAERALRQEIQDTKPRLIAKTLVNLNRWRARRRDACAKMRPIEALSNTRQMNGVIGMKLARAWKLSWRGIEPESGMCSAHSTREAFAAA